MSLADLDELVLQCASDRARRYISEAVSCYKAGAYRASIVASWVAVTFDLLDKLRELALSGDKEADLQAQEFEKLRKAHDVARALAFERHLLELARDKFELVSPIEFTDLERLRDDRNRCAHPSMISEEEVFSPSAELARVHIRAAVEHLLRHPPVQGKYALDRLLQDVESPYFPMGSKEALATLSSGPLRRPRISLVRNYTIVLLKTLLTPKLEFRKAQRHTAALAATRSLHTQAVESVLKEKLSDLFRAISDDDLSVALAFFRRCDGAWEFLSEDVRERLRSYVRQLPSLIVDELEFLLDYPPLAGAALARVHRLTPSEIDGPFWFALPDAVCDRAVTGLLNSDSFATANKWAKAIIANKTDFSAAHQIRILNGAAENDQLTGAFDFKALLSVLRSTDRIPVDDFNKILAEHGLDKYVPQ